MARLLIGNIKGPQGAQGPTGPQGPQGVQGNPGQGVPTGGSAGQYLIKQSATNYDADWGAITTDSAPTSGGTNPITSGGVYTEAGKLAAGMAILANGNTHAAIPSGQFVYVRGHGTLTDGMYKATANIAANGALSTSNLTAVSSGGLNALNSNLTPVEYVLTGSIILRKFGKVCVLSGYQAWSSTQSGQVTIGTLPAEYKPKYAIRALANIGANAWSYNRTAYFNVSESSGDVSVVPADSTGYAAVYVNCSWVLA